MWNTGGFDLGSWLIWGWIKYAEPDDLPKPRRGTDYGRMNQMNTVLHHRGIAPNAHPVYASSSQQLLQSSASDWIGWIAQLVFVLLRSLQMRIKLINARLRSGRQGPVGFPTTSTQPSTGAKSHLRGL